MPKSKTIKTLELLNSVETSLSKVSLRNDGIVEIRFKFSEYEVDVEDQNEIHRAIATLNDNGKIKYHILVVPGQYGGVSKEAREIEMFELDAYQNQKSLAIVVQSFPQRLIGKLYFALKKNKPKYPFNFFPSEASAVNWILSQVQK